MKKSVVILGLILFGITGCQVSGSTNGHAGNANVFTNIFSCEF